jgi:hypothetical protein
MSQLKWLAVQRKVKTPPAPRLHQAVKIIAAFSSDT